MKVYESTAYRNTADRILCGILPYVEMRNQTPAMIANEIQHYHDVMMVNEPIDTGLGMTVILQDAPTNEDKWWILDTPDPAVKVAYNHRGEWRALSCVWIEDDQQFLPENFAQRQAELDYWLTYSGGE